MNKQAILSEIIFLLFGALDVKRWINQRIKRSRPFTVEWGCIYTTNCDPEVLKADIYRPKKQIKKAAVVLVHGGGWTEPECRALMQPIAKQLARCGYVVMNISYRLAPQYQHPAPIEDLNQALNWLHIHSRDLGINKEHIAVYGYSAGGHLAALLAALQSARYRLMAAVAGGAPTDLGKWPGGKLVGQYLGGDYDEIPERYAQASPIHHVHPGMPPMFLYHGTNDKQVPIDQIKNFKARLDAFQVKNELLVLRNHDHITTFFNHKAIEHAIAFLDRILYTQSDPGGSDTRSIQV